MPSVHDQAQEYSFLESPVTRKAMAIVSLSWLVWDSILLCGREYESIWKLVRENSVVKAIYIFSKYVGLIGQILNTISAFHLLSEDHVPPRLCRRWFASQIILIVFLYVALQIILMLRVYALYDCRKPIGYFLLSLGIVEVISVSYASSHIIRGFYFYSTCLIRNTPSIVIALIVVMGLVQVIVWGMTLFKQCDIPARNQLLNIVSRDGAIACAAFVALFATAVPYSFYVQTLTHSMFGIFMSLIIILTSRIILNMQDLKPQGPMGGNEIVSGGGFPVWCLDTTFDSIDEGLDDRVPLDTLSVSETTAPPTPFSVAPPTSELRNV